MVIVSAPTVEPSAVKVWLAAEETEIDDGVIVLPWADVSVKVSVVENVGVMVKSADVTHRREHS